MGKPRTFLGAGLAFLVFGSWALGFWLAGGWGVLLRVGLVLAGLGVVLVAAAVFFRWQGWE